MTIPRGRAHHANGGASEGEVALVAGGGTAVGLACARSLAARGAGVALLDSPAAAADGAARLGESGARAVAVAGDVRVSADVAQAVRATSAELGPPTTVVVAVGAGAPGRVGELDDATWAECLAGTLTSVFLVAKHTVPHLLRGPSGSFVAVTSTAGVRGEQGHVATAAAMHGVVGMLRTIALDHGREGLRCNVVCAGPMEGDLVATDLIPAGRPARADDVAAMVAHLTSSATTFTSGSVQVVDGARAAGPWTAKARLDAS